MALKQLERNTLTLMRAVLDPTKDVEELSRLDYPSDFTYHQLPFGSFSQEFFNSVAADEILSIYDQEHLRDLVRRSCELHPINVDEESVDHHLFMSNKIKRGRVLCSDLFLLMNPAVDESIVSKVLMDYEKEDEDLLIHVPWAAFVYNPRGPYLLSECIASRSTVDFWVVVLFTELESFIKDTVHRHDRTIPWVQWIKESHELAGIAVPAIQESPRGLVVFEDDGAILTVEDSQDVSEVASLLAEAFMPTKQRFDWETMVSFYMNLARWARALARRSGQPEPTFALERIL